MGAEPTLAWTLQRPAAQYANKVATIDRGTGERRIWSEVADRVNGLSSGLLGLDLEIGDRVGALMLNSGRHFELWFAIPGAGMVMNDLNYRLAEEELAFICGDSDVKVLFVDDNYLDVGRALLQRVDSLHTLVWTGPGDAAPKVASRTRRLLRRLSSIFLNNNTTASPQSFTPEVQQGFQRGRCSPIATSPQMQCTGSE